MLAGVRRDAAGEEALIEFATLLASLDDGVLGALIATLERLQGILPALHAWLEHAARWEIDRREGFAYPLQPPMAAISPDELPEAIATSVALRNAFAEPRHPAPAAVSDFFDRLRDALAAEEERLGARVH